jgi:hypothetical protein
LLLATVKEEDGCDSAVSENSVDTRSNNSTDDTGDKKSTDSGGSSSSASVAMDIDDAPTSQFTVMLRQCHLGKMQKQYLVSECVHSRASSALIHVPVRPLVLSIYLVTD